jgi:hypothetical protein
MTRLMVTALSSALICTACATAYRNTDKENSAIMSVSLDSDSVGTTNNNVFAWAFQDESCARNSNGTLLTQKLGNKSTKETPAVSIAANKKFTFTTVYIESRIAQTRQCALMATFEPRSGRKYRTQLVSREQGLSCSLGIYDVTDSEPRQVEFTMPDEACMFGGRSAENGKPLWTDYEVHFHAP